MAHVNPRPYALHEKRAAGGSGCQGYACHFMDWICTSRDQWKSRSALSDSLQAAADGRLHARAVSQPAKAIQTLAHACKREDSLSFKNGEIISSNLVLHDPLT
jgi:hypothetical protein